jgi:predicted HTH domain antitoxin
MTFTPERITIQDVLSLTRYLSDEDRQWLAELLNRLDDAPLPTQATLDEAITLYLADACSLGRAAELAGVTRWDIMDELAARGIPLLVHHTRNAQEIDDLAEELEREGIL